MGKVSFALFVPFACSLFLMVLVAVVVVVVLCAVSIDCVAACSLPVVTLSVTVSVSFSVSQPVSIWLAKFLNWFQFFTPCPTLSLALNQSFACFGPCFASAALVSRA